MPNVSHAGLAPALGKKQENLLTAILRGVPLLDRDNEAQDFADADVRRFLAAFRPHDAAYDSGEVNRLRPRVLDAVIGAQARRHGYIKGLPQQGVEPLLRAAARAVRSPVVLRVVFGATTRVPLRALSYVLPAVHMVARVSAAAYRAPYLQVVLTGSLGGRINDMPEDTVADEKALLTDCLDRLLRHLAPVGRFGVYGDRSPAVAIGLLSELVAELTPGQRGHILERLKTKGGSRTEQQTLLYAAAHALLHDRGGVPLELERGTAVPDDPVVIDIGGLQERHFHHARAHFVSRPGTDGPGPLVLTRHAVPPYTTARGGEVGLREFLDGRGHDGEPLTPAVLRDLDQLWSTLSPYDLRAVLDAPVGALL